MKKVIRTRVGTSSRTLKRSERSRTRKSATSATIRVEFASRFSDYSESPMEATARGRSTVLPFYRGWRASSPRPDRGSRKRSKSEDSAGRFSRTHPARCVVGASLTRARLRPRISPLRRDEGADIPTYSAHPLYPPPPPFLFTTATKGYLGVCHIFA